MRGAVTTIVAALRTTLVLCRHSGGARMTGGGAVIRRMRGARASRRLSMPARAPWTGHPPAST